MQNAIVCITLLILVCAALAFGAVRLWSLGPVLMAVGLACVLWVLRLLLVREVRVVFSLLGAPVLVFAAYGIVRYGLSDVEPAARQAMLLMLASALLFFLVLNNVRHRWHVSAVAWTVSATGTLLALYGLGQWIWGGRWVWWFPQYDAYIGRASGTFIRPHHFAAFLQMAFSIAAANFLFSRRSPAQKIALFFGCVVMGAGLLLALAPSGWLGWLTALIVLGVYVIRKRGKKFRWLMVGAALMGLVLIVTLLSAHALRAPQPGAPAAAEPPQLALWRSAWQIGRANLWLGAGPGMFQWLYPAHRTLQGQPVHAGNEYLNLFAEYGLVGCLLVAWIGVGFILGTVQILHVRADRYSAATPSNRYAFAVGGLAGFCAVVVGSIFDSSLHAPANLLTLATIMATVLTCGVHPSGKVEQDALLPGRYATVPMKGIPKLVLAGALALATLLLVTRLGKTYASDLMLRLAERQKAELNWPAAERLYMRAWNLDKRNFEVTTALGDFYSARATWKPAQRETLLEQALSWYERAWTANSYAADVLIKTARIYDALGKRQLANQRYQRALRLDPRNASYHAQLGLHHQRWGDQDQAIVSFSRAYNLGGPDPLAEIQLRQLGKLGP